MSTAHADTKFEVVTALAGERAGIALVSVTTDDPIRILTDIEGRPDVVSTDLLWTQDTTVLLQIETTDPPLLLPLWRTGIPVELPFTIRDGEATWELTTSASRFSELGSVLEEAGIEYELEHVVGIGETEADRLLTDRQREVVTAAIDEGYYAVPREATLTEVAERLGVSKATCSDVLHRAESSIVTWFAEEQFGVPRFVRDGDQ